MILGLQKKHNFTMKDSEVDDYVDRELGKVIEKLSADCTECTGVTKQLEWAKEQGYPMAVVSTSAKPRVIASLIKCNLLRFFDEKHVYSAATSLTPPSSKPDPKIYIYACEQLGVKPEETLTVEDSKSGATAAMRANIPLIAYVGVYGEEEGKEKMDEMAKKLETETKATATMYDWKEFPECVKKIESHMK
jgi:HAD superfamily hydrolase (TIGR01509 family)